MLLLELPQLCIDVKRSAKVGLPLLVSVLGHIPEAVEELLGLFQEVAKLVDNFSVLLVTG